MAMTDRDRGNGRVWVGIDPPGSGAEGSDLTPTPRASDERDWSFGGTWPYEPRRLFTDGIRIHFVQEDAHERAIPLALDFLRRT